MCSRLTQIILKTFQSSLGQRLSVKRMGSGKITGSRYADGDVPNVNWNNGKMKVNRYNPDNANDNLRLREEVSQKSRVNRDFWTMRLLQIFYPAVCHFRNFL